MADIDLQPIVVPSASLLPSLLLCVCAFSINSESTSERHGEQNSSNAVKFTLLISNFSFIIIDWGNHDPLSQCECKVDFLCVFAIKPPMSSSEEFTAQFSQKLQITQKMIRKMSSKGHQANRVKASYLQQMRVFSCYLITIE